MVSRNIVTVLHKNGTDCNYFPQTYSHAKVGSLQSLCPITQNFFHFWGQKFFSLPNFKINSSLRIVLCSYYSLGFRHGKSNKNCFFTHLRPPKCDFFMFYKGADTRNGHLLSSRNRTAGFQIESHSLQITPRARQTLLGTNYTLNR